MLNEVFDLFVELDADDEQLDFPMIYAAGRQGVATTDLAVEPKDLQPLYKEILTHIPPPDGGRRRAAADAGGVADLQTPTSAGSPSAR